MVWIGVARVVRIGVPLAACLLVSCRHGAPRLDSPACVVPLTEYQCPGGKCPTFGAALDRARAERSVCPMGYSVGTCGALQVLVHNDGIRGRTEYYDREGVLVGAFLWLDAPAFCDGRSFGQQYGPDPACEVQITDRLCAGQDPKRPTSGRLATQPWSGGG